jgi:hypothetical protein
MHAASQSFESVARIAKRIDRERDGHDVTQKRESRQRYDSPSVICKDSKFPSGLDTPR